MGMSLDRSYTRSVLGILPNLAIEVRQYGLPPVLFFFITVDSEGVVNILLLYTPVLSAPCTHEGTCIVLLRKRNH